MSCRESCTGSLAWSERLVWVATILFLVDRAVNAADCSVEAGLFEDLYGVRVGHGRVVDGGTYGGDNAILRKRSVQSTILWEGYV
jgi:hypothetical protein